jgi:hypothetical protein
MMRARRVVRSDFEEYLPLEAGSSGETDSAGRIVPRPVVRCRVCGHQEREAIVLRAPDPARPVPAQTREQLMAKADAMRRQFMWRTIEDGVRTQGFPIYAAVGWPAQVTQSGSEDDGRLTTVAVAHFRPHDANDWRTGIQPVVSNHRT